MSSSSSAAEPPAGPARGDEDADRPDRQATGHVPAATTPRLEVGRIEKVHGLRGEVVVQLVTNLAAARTAPGAVLWAGGDALQVVAARRHRNRWLIAFDGVTDRATAEGLRGRTLSAPPLDAADGATIESDGFASELVGFAHELIGRRVVDQHGVDHGEVVALVDNPAADLLELADGRLVPLSFHVRHDATAVHVDVPPGLLDADTDAMTTAAGADIDADSDAMTTADDAGGPGGRD